MPTYIHPIHLQVLAADRQEAAQRLVAESRLRRRAARNQLPRRRILAIPWRRLRPALT